MDLRSGRIVSADEHLTLLAPYLPNDEPEPYLRALIDLQNAMRDGVFALLQLAMRRRPARRRAARHHSRLCEGRGDRLADCQLPALELDRALDRQSRAAARRRSPPRSSSLLEDKDKFARLLPWLLKVVRSQDAFPKPEEALRDLIAEVRAHFRKRASRSAEAGPRDELSAPSGRLFPPALHLALQTRAGLRRAVVIA